MDATYWQSRAQEAIAAGYMPGNQWERMLGRALQRSRPELVQELGSDLEAYLQTMTWQAIGNQRVKWTHIGAKKGPTGVQEFTGRG
jgi:hypothetical protein